MLEPIEVNVINVHGPNSHIELELSRELPSGSKLYYTINQWQEPDSDWATDRNGFVSWPFPFVSQYSFTIQADPAEVIREWKVWHAENIACASPLYHNCADAVEWFCERFADVPKSHFYQTPLSINHMICGIPWLSCAPFPVTLPGRVMDNIKEWRERPTQEQEQEQASSDKSVPTTIFSSCFGGLCFWNKEPNITADEDLALKKSM